MVGLATSQHSQWDRKVKLFGFGVVCRVVVEMQKTLGHKFIGSSAFLYIFIEVGLRVVKRI